MSGSSGNETIYALRRTLVRRLQAASRGVSRRTRYETHRAFALEWDEVRRTGRMGVLQRALDGGEPVLEPGSPPPGLLLTLALGANHAAPVGKTEVAAEGAGLAFSGSPVGSAEGPAESPPAAAAQQPSQNQPGALQAELFGRGLVMQPL